MSWKLWLFKIGAFLAVAGALLLKAFNNGRKSMKEKLTRQSQKRADGLDAVEQQIDRGEYERKFRDDE